MIAPTSFFSDYGGHIRILEEARVLQKLGHHVTILTYYLGRDLPIQQDMLYHHRLDLYSSKNHNHNLFLDFHLLDQILQLILVAH